jgi:hypothetical protein
MTDENSNAPNNSMAESSRLSKAVSQLLAEEHAPAGAGILALSISIGNAIRKFSKPDNLEANLAQTIETIRRVATGQPPTN